MASARHAVPLPRSSLPKDGPDLRAGMLCSAVLHVLVALVAIFGLPSLMSPPPEIEEPMVVELAPLGESTTPPPRQVEAPKPEEKPAPPPKLEAPPTPPEPKPEPPKPEPVKPEPPKPTPPPPPPKVEPEPEPEPVPAPKPKPEPPKEQPKPPPDVLKDIKPPPKKTPPPDDWDTLLKNVDKLRKATPPQPQPQPQTTPAAGRTTVNSQSLDANAQPTLSEQDWIRAQIEPHWMVDPGAKGAESIVVRVRIQFAPDGTVLQANLDIDESRYASDAYYRAAADAARRAAFTASPLKIPPNRPDFFRQFPQITLNFNPRNLVR